METLGAAGDDSDARINISTLGIETTNLALLQFGNPFRFLAISSQTPGVFYTVHEGPFQVLSLDEPRFACLQRVCRTAGVDFLLILK